jgi:hypothetical protein
MTHANQTLALALTAALAAPMALAQSGDTTQTQNQQATQTTQTDAVVREQLLTTNAPVAEQLDETRPPPVSEGMEEEEEEAMRRDRRPTERTGEPTRAADESAPARRDLWAELDANGDGRISVIEGDANADFRSNFEMMDADQDGYVSDAEYRAREGAAEEDDDE